MVREINSRTCWGRGGLPFALLRDPLDKKTMSNKVTQAQRVVQYMVNVGPITQADADRELGIKRLASRIHDLRKEKYVISDKRISVTDRWGDSCRVSQYTFVDYPPKTTKQQGELDKHFAQARKEFKSWPKSRQSLYRELELSYASQSKILEKKKKKLSG